MVSGTERILEDLHHVMAEVEGLLKETAASAADGAGERARELQGILARARARYGDLEKKVGRDLRHGAHVADRYVHENTWKSLATVAGAAFLLGLLAGRRN